MRLAFARSAGESFGPHHWSRRSTHSAVIIDLPSADGAWQPQSPPSVLWQPTAYMHGRASTVVANMLIDLVSGCRTQPLGFRVCPALQPENPVSWLKEYAQQHDHLLHTCSQRRQAALLKRLSGTAVVKLPILGWSLGNCLLKLHQGSSAYTGMET